MERVRGRVPCAEDLHPAQSDQQFAEPRRVVLGQGSPLTRSVSTPLLEAPAPPTADPPPPLAD